MSCTESCGYLLLTNTRLSKKNWTATILDEEINYDKDH